jgi:PAS domain S-box-containing protein
MDAASERRNWMEEIPAGQFRHLFDHLPGTLFFAKDRQGRLMAGNPAFVKRCGFTKEEQIVGLTDHQIFPPRLAEKYHRDDEKLITTRQPMLGLIELFPNSQGRPEWFITDKLPLFDKNGGVCGLCGTVRSYEEQRAAIQPYLELAEVAEHLKMNFRERLEVSELAEIAGLSVRQFERKFRKTFQTTPRSYLMRMRVIKACELLAGTNLPITEVALESGFYDHSDFSRQFRKHMGQAPTAYRREKRGGGGKPPPR